MGQQAIHGEIELHCLTEWWLSAFTDAEREYIDNRYQPMGAGAHSLTQGDLLKHNANRQLDTATFLSGLATWFRRKEDADILRRVEAKIESVAAEHPISGPGYVDGRLFSTHVKDVERFKKSGNWQEAETLLLRLVDTTEEQAKSNGGGVAPWYYGELAKIYRRNKDYRNEVLILERYADQGLAPGVKPAQLLERLDKARALLRKSEEG